MQKVTMYTSAYCPYCVMAKRLLSQYGVNEVQEVRVDQHPDKYAHMQQITGLRSVPQIFIGETHVGGFDSLNALNRAGQLEALLNAE